jgi:hypothetical protein
MTADENKWEQWMAATRFRRLLEYIELNFIYPCLSVFIRGLKIDLT